MRPLPASAALLCALLVAAPAWAEVKAGPVLVHTGMCEASGAVAYPPGGFDDRFLVVDDEDNRLRLYAAGAGGPALALGDANLGPALGLSGKKAADFEGATWLGSHLVLTGSHSRNRHGEVSESRRRLVAVRVSVGDKPGVVVAGTARRDLAPAFAALDRRLAKAIGPEGAPRPKLDPKRKGFNIEGLAAAPDGATLWFGLRNPLTRRGEALVVPLENPREVLERDAAPRFVRPVPLALGGRGIRAMAFSPASGGYTLVAGPVGNDGAFDLYRWSGRAGEAPQPVPGAAAALAALPQFQPEGLVADPASDRVRLLSDDGNRTMPDGRTCDRSDAPAFRSVVLDLR
ncbi:DUF3616 domain-containing protein [uncultured Methylobacterium sp.]|jgi:hypothetical protein|uniref:DUF3616 domain-containing protein n=1 Tax=uncultured Methylobacterium sp. TaxID=157278 RepID=UPI002621D00A|nr:DUF3616 domain-containing protein [uncultured Methylobacterium sp.]